MDDFLNYQSPQNRALPNRLRSWHISLTFAISSLLLWIIGAIVSRASNIFGITQNRALPNRLRSWHISLTFAISSLLLWIIGAIVSPASNIFGITLVVVTGLAGIIG